MKELVQTGKGPTAASVSAISLEGTAKHVSEIITHIVQLNTFLLPDLQVTCLMYQKHLVVSKS